MIFRTLKLQWWNYQVKSLRIMFSHFYYMNLTDMCSTSHCATAYMPCLYTVIARQLYCCRDRPNFIFVLGQNKKNISYQFFVTEIRQLRTRTLNQNTSVEHGWRVMMQNVILQTNGIVLN